MTAGKPRARLTVDQLHNRIEEGRVEARTAEERRQRRKPEAKREEGIAHMLDEPETLEELRKRREERERREGKRRRKGRFQSRGMRM